MWIVDGLNQSSWRNIVFSHCHFEQSVIGELTCALHQTFAEWAVADHHGTVKILERAGDDFRRRRRSAVNKHGKRYLCVHRVDARLIDFLVEHTLAPGGKHCGALGQEDAEYLHSTLHEATAITSQVKDKTLGSILYKLFHACTHILITLLRERVESHITDIVGKHPIVGHGRYLNLASLDVDGKNRVLYPRTLDCDFEHRAALTLEMLTHLLDIPTGHRVIVNHKDEVAGTQPRHIGRAPLIRLGNYNTFGGHLYARAYASVFTGSHGAELFLGFGRDIFRVRVDIIEHGGDSRVDWLLRVNRVDVKSLKLLVQGVEYVEVSGDVVLLATRGGWAKHCESHESGNQDY